MKFGFWLMLASLGVRLAGWELLVEDTFEEGLDNWVVEQNSGTVKVVKGQLEIDDGGGATVWYRQKLKGPVRIEYDVVMVEEGGRNDRVSDLNCFWMAVDPRHPDNLFREGHGRKGVFKHYHHLRLYYVGYGGHDNTRIRFRRYKGTGERPLDPEHDLKGGSEPNQRIRIRLEADGERIRYVYNGKLVYDIQDPDPYREGWFAFRTVRNRMRVDNFRVFTRPEAGKEPTEAGPPQIPAVLKRPPWKRHVLDRGLAGADGVRTGDVDGDGDLDLAIGWEEAGTVRVYRNPGLSRQALTLSWPWMEFQNLAGVEDAHLSDLDGDGRPDLIVSQEKGGERITVFWAPAEEGATWDTSQWTRMEIPVSRGRQWMFSQCADLNGDGRMDLIAGGKNRRAVLSLFPGPVTPRDPTAWENVVLSRAGWIMSLRLEDMDGDGDLDVLISDRRPGGDGQGLRWLEHPGGNDTPWTSHLIGGEGQEVMFLEMADLDGDGRREILLPILDLKNRPNSWLLFRRLDETGRNWQTESYAFPVEAGNAKALRVADLEGKGQLELVASFGMALSPLKGVMGFKAKEGGWAPYDISGPEGEKFDLIQLLDLDGDGDLDVISTEEDADKDGPGLGLVVYENPAEEEE